MVVRFMQGTDFYEGVKAQLIDKSGAPEWKPASLADVSDDQVAEYFEPLPPDVPELELGPEPGGRAVARQSDEPSRQRSRL